MNGHEKWLKHLHELRYKPVCEMSRKELEETLIEVRCLWIKGDKSNTNSIRFWIKEAISLMKSIKKIPGYGVLDGNPYRTV